MASAEFDADLNACAALVEQADAWRFRATMAAPVAARRVLFPIYAFNVEVSRAPWVTSEPMIAAMRLQWWRDALDEIAARGVVRRHEVVTPLATVLDAEGAGLLDALVAARDWDTGQAPFADMAAFDAYIAATSGNLVWAVARALGGAEEDVARDAGWALGLANWFLAVPALEGAGRHPLPDTTPGAIAALAGRGLDCLRRARGQRGDVPLAAVLPVAGTGRILAQAAARPDMVRAGGLGPGPGRQSLALSWAALTGRW